MLDRILPPKKEASIFIDLPTMKTSPDILEAIHRVAQAVSRGELSPTEGDCLTRIIERQAKVIEMNDFRSRCARTSLKSKTTARDVSSVQGTCALSALQAKIAPTTVNRMITLFFEIFILKGGF